MVTSFEAQGHLFLGLRILQQKLDSFFNFFIYFAFATLLPDDQCA